MAPFWKVCKECIGICDGAHAVLMAEGDLREQRCRWEHAATGVRCALAAPHAGPHFNPYSDGETKWIDMLAVDEFGRPQRRDGRSKRRKKPLYLVPRA